MSLKMKELEARTGVTREAIRFYIREGLLPEPEKPKRNVALYTEEHVARTRLIKELQDKHFLPLKMVKAVLESSDTRSVAENQRLGLSHFLPALLRDTTPGPDRSIAELAESTGLSCQEIEALAGIGAVSVSPDGLIDFRDAAIITAWGQAHARGFDEKHGYNEVYFSRYVEAMRQLADFEVTRFLHNFESVLDGESAGKLAAEGIDIANRLLSLLHTKFVVEAVTEKTNAGS